MSQIGFLGTGLLGSGMVENLLRRGHQVTVWNRTESKARALAGLGAAVASSPEQAAAGAERVHMALSDDAAVYTIEHIGDEPANVGAMGKVPDSVFANLGITRDLEAFLRSGIFQRRLKDKDKIVGAWTDIKSGLQ